MQLRLDTEELKELMKDFYVLTGIKLVLFDVYHNELIAYPDRAHTLCDRLRLDPAFLDKCTQSDMSAFSRCKATKNIVIYKCHAGLVEAMAPILQNDQTIGYLIFGQVRDIKDKDTFIHMLQEAYPNAFQNRELAELAKKVKYKNREQILAASKILDAFTHYLLLKEMVRTSSRGLLTQITDYITLHTDEELSIDSLCSRFRITRTALYDLFRRELSMGVAAYIKHKRLEKAKNLLETTDLSVNDICIRTGFSDYNYFLRIYKRAYGVSAKAHKKRMKQNN